MQTDSVTSLPLSHSLLTFYRERLKDTLQKTTLDFNKQLKQLRPEVDHVHQVEMSVSSSNRAINALQEENDDLRNLLKEMIEDNAKLRLSKAPQTFDQTRTDRLLQAIEQRPHQRQDHVQILSSMVDRCQSLEALASNTIADLNVERAQREKVEIKLVELEETLAYNTKELMDQLQHYESQPSLEDFEFVKSQVESMKAERDVDQREIAFLRTENESLRASLQSSKPTHQADDKLRAISGNQQRYHLFPKTNHHEEGSEHDTVLEDDLDKMSQKLKSLERFANKFMSAETHGVPEFFHTIDKSKSRVEDIEARLAKRMQARRECR